MTDNRIEKIRAEIERLKHQSVIDSDRQAERGLQSASMASFGKVKACEELLSFIDSMQKEPKACMYSKDSYTDEDRKVLCDGCEEECRFNKKEDSASEELEKVVEEIVDPTVLNAYGVKEIANRLRRTMMDSVSEIDFEAEVKKLWMEINTGHSYSIVDSYNIFYGLCMDIVDWQKEQQNIIEPTGEGQVKESLISEHEDKTCKENGNSLTQEPISDDLEQAIDTYLATYFGGDKEKQYWPFLKKMAINFAEWQKKKDDYAIEIAHMAGEEEGKNIMKQKMMANAVDGAFIRRNRYTKKNVLNGFDTTCDAIQGFKDKDKIKVIFVKEG